MCEFIDDRANQRSTESAVIADVPSVSGGNRRPLRILLIGDRSDVTETIKNLHARGFAPAGQWSRPAPWLGTESNEQMQLLTLPVTSVMSVCTKFFS